jgi:hypothetical protein
LDFFVVFFLFIGFGRNYLSIVSANGEKAPGIVNWLMLNDHFAELIVAMSSSFPMCCWDRHAELTLL